MSVFPSRSVSKFPRENKHLALAIVGDLFGMVQRTFQRLSDLQLYHTSYPFISPFTGVTTPFTTRGPSFSLPQIIQIPNPRDPITLWDDEQGVYDHHLRKLFRSQKVIGSLELMNLFFTSSPLFCRWAYEFLLLHLLHHHRPPKLSSHTRLGPYG